MEKFNESIHFDKRYMMGINTMMEMVHLLYTSLLMHVLFPPLTLSQNVE